MYNSAFIFLKHVYFSKRICLIKSVEIVLKTLLCVLQWSDLYATKPDDDYEDPDDIEAIREAKVNMGDYKLKTADNYVVPDHLRMNVEKARGRLLVLKDLVSFCFLCVFFVFYSVSKHQYDTIVQTHLRIFI